jgi:threonine/homoserine/homoserine lactone efflux protein
MNHLFSAAGIVLAAVLSPGPNNLLVLQRAGDHGLASALKPIAGIVMGGLAMIAFAQAGLGAIALQTAWIRAGILAGGAIYLTGLGLLLILRPAGDAVSVGGPRIAASGVLGTFAFQFINPKAWLLALTVSAASTTGLHHGHVDVRRHFVRVPSRVGSAGPHSRAVHATQSLPRAL